MKKVSLIEKLSLLVILIMILGMGLATIDHYTKGSGDRKNTVQESINKKFEAFFIDPEADSTKITNPLLPKEIILEDTSTDLNDMLNQIYDERKVLYEAKAESIRSILLFLTTLLIVGLLILFYQPKELNMPIVNISIPNKLFYFFIPVAITYFWFQFSLTINAVVDSRIALELMIDHMETIKGQQVAYYYSRARTLVDQGFVDTWCTFYYDIFRGGINPEAHKVNAGVGLFGTYGTLWGLVHSLGFVMVMDFHNKFKNRLIWLLFTSVVVSFSLCSIGAIMWYPYSADLFLWVWIVALLATLFWIFKGKHIAAEIAKKEDNPQKTRLAKWLKQPES